MYRITLPQAMESWHDSQSIHVEVIYETLIRTLQVLENRRHRYSLVGD